MTSTIDDDAVSHNIDTNPSLNDRMMLLLFYPGKIPNIVRLHTDSYVNIYRPFGIFQFQPRALRWGGGRSVFIYSCKRVVLFECATILQRFSTVLPFSHMKHHCTMGNSNTFVPTKGNKSFNTTIWRLWLPTVICILTVLPLKKMTCKRDIWPRTDLESTIQQIFR